MQFGVVLPTEYPRDASARACLETITETATRSEALGFDSLWVGEHHFTDHIYFDNFQLLASLATRTDAVRLGTSVCLAPLHNPVHLAEKIANVDVLSDGRFIFGAGVGYRQQEFDVFGVDRSTRGRRMTETLQLLTRLWNDDDVSFDGTEFTFEDVSINPKPVQDGGPELWIGASAPPAIRRAAEMGDAWLIDPRVSLEELREPYAVYQDALGSDEPSARPIWREVFVAESTEEAFDAVQPHLLEKYETYFSWDDDDAAPDPHAQFERMVEERFLIGTPAEVSARLADYREAYGIDQLLLRGQWLGMDPERARQSLELFADEVMPQFA